jgi:hypothetical protein
MTVSVIIPTVLRSTTVARCIQSVSESAARFHPDAEVLLVVNGAGATVPPPAPAPNVRILYSSATGVSEARNDGVAAARHDTILFTDDDLTVPPDWCATMAAPLNEGAWGVSAPVRMERFGPITAYLDHERAFDAAPLKLNTSRSIVTANAGYRRDLMPGPAFDNVRYPRFAEDTDLGLRIQEAGGVIRWLNDAPMPVHEVEEEAASLVRRALRQGTGTVQTYLQRRMLDYYYPAPMVSYRHISRAEQSPRQFLEVANTAMRTVFATLSLIRHASALAGYLDGLGDAHGVKLVDIDEPAFIAGLDEVIGALLESVGPQDWTTIPVRFAPVTPYAQPVPAETLAGIADVLTRTGPLDADAPVPPEGTCDDLAWLAWDATNRTRLASVWRRLTAGGIEPDQETVNRAVRDAGVAFGRACSIRETVTDSKVRAWPGAAKPVIAPKPVPTPVPA